MTAPMIRRLTVLLGVAAVFVSSMPASAEAGPGALDSAFGDRGSITTSVMPQLLVPVDGGFLVAGVPLAATPSEVVLERRDEDGTPVQDFGSGGTTTIPNLLGVRLADVEAEADGAILVGAKTSGSTWTVARLSAQGELDDGFGDHGLATVPAGVLSELVGITTRPDGGVVLAGWVYRTQDSRNQRVQVVALDASGHLDPSYGDDGFVVYGPKRRPVTAADVVGRADGSVVIAATIRRYPRTGFAQEPILLRLTPSGALDPSFGDDGVVSARELPTGDPRAWALLERTDGRLVLFGFNDRFDSAYLAGYRANGTPDPNTPARTILYVEDESVLAHPSFQTDGKIVIGVETHSCVDGCEPPRSFLVRLRVDGRPNLTFNAPPVAQHGVASAVLDSGRLLLGVYGPNTVFAYTS